MVKHFLNLFIHIIIGMKAEELIKKRDIPGLIKYYEENTGITSLDWEKQFKSLNEFKNFMHEFTLENSKRAVKQGLLQDDLVSVYVNYLDVLDELINSWFERVFELFTLYYPEASIKAQDLNTFAQIKKLDRKTLSKLFKVDEKSMGMDFAKEDVILLDESIRTLNSLISQKSDFESRIKDLVIRLAVNTSNVAGEIVAARLIAVAGSLRRLSLMPSSTIQVLGAEKALFRHLRSRKAKPPKHGLIFHSRFVSSVDPKHRGKMARALASKISIASKVDYYKGDLIWKKLVSSLEAKLKGLKK